MAMAARRDDLSHFSIKPLFIKLYKDSNFVDFLGRKSIISLCFFHGVPDRFSRRPEGEDLGWWASWVEEGNWAGEATGAVTFSFLCGNVPGAWRGIPSDLFRLSTNFTIWKK